MNSDSSSFFFLRGKGKNVISRTALHTFVKQNPKLEPFINKHPVKLHLLDHSPFEALIHWVISQQISSYVAEIMINRFKSIYPHPLPQDLLIMPTPTAKQIGLSQAKKETITRLAHFFLKHPDLTTNNLKQRTTHEVMQLFLPIKGIGEWTIQMFLIFHLGKLDVLAAKDLAVRKGVQILYDLHELPSPKEVRRIARPWKPYETIGTLLAWAVIDPA